MKNNTKVKIFMYAIILIFGFFNILSFIPLSLKNNFLIEELKIKTVSADVVSQFPTTNYLYSGAGFDFPENLYADDSIYGTSTPEKNKTSGNAFGNFNFDSLIPNSSTINTVNVIYKFRVSTADSKASLRIRMIVDGTELANYNNTDEPLADQIYTLDITGDLSWTKNDLIDGIFEIIVEPRRGNSSIVYDSIWDYVKVEIDFTPPPPNITSMSAENEQIGNVITIFGSNFGSTNGTLDINNQTVANINSWTNTQIEALAPGQEGAININGKIQVIRSIDEIPSNLYPPDPLNFTILAPSVSGSIPAFAETGETAVDIDFFGLGIDTDTGTDPILKLTKTGELDITGTSYLKITDYQTARATFDLTGAATGYWNLVITNMDGQSGYYGDETTIGFNIIVLAPTVTGIDPGFGANSGVININSITGNDFQNGATGKLTKTAEIDIVSAPPFTFTDANTISNGAFDIAGKTLGWWNVVVTNPDLQTGSYGNETDSGFEIRTSQPSNPSNLYQFKDSSDAGQPPTTNILVGDGIGEQTEIYFRMDMEGGITGENYYPQVEVKLIGSAFECDNSSPTPCSITSGFFFEGSGVLYNGIAVQGWTNIDAADGSLYHWQTRVRNSSGTSDWVSFGGNNDPNDRDIYIDNTPPAISPGSDGTCSTASVNITDSNTTIIWDTSDSTSGAEPPPGSGSYGTAQVQYIKTGSFVDWITTPGSLSPENIRENSPHQIILTGLSPSANYTFRMLSKDTANNEGFSVDCAFSTEIFRPIKTVELFINQETDQNTGTRISKDFSVYIPESPFADISLKSAFIEVSGISDATPAQTINIELRRGNSQTFVPLGADYTIDSTGTTTPFVILFDALNPPGTGQEDMSNITTGATNYDYTLFLNGTAIPISIFSAKLIITYSYVL